MSRATLHFYDGNICQDAVKVCVEDCVFVINASVIKKRSVYLRDALDVDKTTVFISKTAATSYQVYTFLRTCYEISGYGRSTHYTFDEWPEETPNTEFFDLYLKDIGAFDVEARFLSFMGADADVWKRYDKLIKRVYEERLPAIEHSDIFVLDQYRENIPETITYFSLYVAATMLKNPKFRKILFHENEARVATLSSDTLARIMSSYFLGESEAMIRWDTSLERASFEYTQQQYGLIGTLMWNMRHRAM